ncbi:alpha/beta fold hydrolase [Aquabacterium sp.]|uniref:alpha/beta fold hydrolase n=1 Tax=Aquabacterium sp. TaxID=1872578 RepID=UPI003784F344
MPAPRRAGRSETLTVRGLRYHLMVWGDPASAQPNSPLRVMMHGWMDVGASFQFVVDELAALGDDGPVVAPDWRGFGRTQASGSDSYWFPDYLGDLDALLDALSPERPVDLLGHSMGGNVVMTYAGVRPQRIRRLVNLEGFGLPDAPAEQAPQRLAQWLDELKTPQRLRPYDTVAAVAQRLQQTNPRLAADKAAWLAGHWAAPDGQGQWQLCADAAHKRVNPVLYRASEAAAIWQRIEAPVLWVQGQQSRPPAAWHSRFLREEFEARLGGVRQLQRVALPDAGHMLHHDQPRALAAFLQDFWQRAA